MTIKQAKQVTGGQPPIGQPFEYTETLDFASDKTYPWWKFWARHKKQPVAWLVSDEDKAGGGVQAHLMTNKSGEVRISPVEPAAPLTPIYVKDLVEDLLLSAGVEQKAQAWIPSTEELAAFREELGSAMAADHKLLREREEATDGDA